MGLPIPKTKVVLKKYNNIYPLDVVNQPTVSVPFYLETVIDSTVADSLGRFAFKDLAMGTYHVYCTHPDFNPKDVHVAFAKDTSITVIMLAKTAAATVTGTVTVVSTTDGITIVRQPLPGCTVEVSRPMIYYYAVDQAAPAAVPGSLPSVSLRAVTDKNGAYTIAKIPLAYTNESWQVRTVNSGYTDGYESVSLANMRTDTVDFDLQKAYDNSVSDTVDGIIYTVATNKKVYTSGESVWSRYTVFNGTQSAVSFGPFSKNCEYEMTVTSGKTTIFALSDSTECLESLAPVYVKIKSLGKATKSFPAWYPPKNAASQSPLSATPYTIAARFRSDTYNATEVAVTIAVMKSTTPTLPETAVQRTTMVLRRSGNNVFLNLPFAQTVSMIVYRLDGSIEPAAGVSTSFTSGMHVLPVETRRLSAGIYLVKVTAGEFSTAFRVVKADR
jgi:hypothetical protein